VFLGLVDGDGFAEAIPGADERADLEFVVEHFAGAEGGAGLWVVVRRGLLAAGPADVGAGCHDRRRAPVVPDGDVLVVGQERVVGPEHGANGRGVVDGGVEVGVVGNVSYWATERDFARGDHSALPEVARRRVHIFGGKERAHEAAHPSRNVATGEPDYVRARTAEQVLGGIRGLTPVTPIAVELGKLAVEEPRSAQVVK
jgi:hypothetical protein